MAGAGLLSIQDLESAHHRDVDVVRVSLINIIQKLSSRIQSFGLHAQSAALVIQTAQY